MAAQFPGDDLWNPEWKAASGEETIQKRQQETDPDVILYSSWFCPFAQRAWIAAEETGCKYKWVEINPYEVDPSQPGGYTKKSLSSDEKERLHPGFTAASPRGLVPAVKMEKGASNVVVWESLPVAEFLGATFGGDSPLVPDDPYQRAIVQIWSTHCTERIQKAYYRALMSQDPEIRDRSVQDFYKECRSLSAAMAPQEQGPYFLGSRFSLVDVALAPFWHRFICVGGHYFGLKFPENDTCFDRLAQWWKMVRTRPAVAATIVCTDRLISSYSDYYRNVATSDFARNQMK